MKRNNIFKSLTFLMSGLVVFIATSCKDDFEDTGLQLIDKSEQLLIKHDNSQTMQSYSYSYKNNIQESTHGKAFIGNVNTPGFGTTEYSNMLFFNTSKTKPDFDSLTLESVNLHVSLIASQFGNDPINVSVHQLTLLDTDTNPLDTLFNTHFIKSETLNDFVNISETLSEIEIVSTNDSTRVDSFELPLTFADPFLDPENLNDSINNFDTIAQFQGNIFRGLYLSVTNNQNHTHLATLNTSDSKTKIVFNFKKNNGEDVVYEVALSDYQNLFQNNFSEIDENSYVQDTAMDFGSEITPNLQNEVLYIKNAYGFSTRLRITDILDRWSNEDTLRAINRAYLKLNLAQEVEDTLTIKAYRVLPNNKVTSLFYHSEFVATYNKDAKGYEITITKALQGVIDTATVDNDFIELELSATSQQGTPQALILNSPTNKENPLKLVVSYTEL